MGRILALDYGLKRTGVAVTDPLQLIATGVDTVDTHRLDAFIDRYVTENEVEAIVVGMPRQMDNTPSASYAHIRPFVARLAKKYPAIKIELVDERFTSKMALRALIDGGVKRSDRRDKALIDRVSATIILQSYLESRAMARSRENNDTQP